jgi:hypothetical protein
MQRLVLIFVAVLMVGTGIGAQTQPTQTFQGTVNGTTWTFEHNHYSEFRLQRGEQTEIGDMNTERGWQDDMNATVYVLHPNAKADLQLLLVRSTGTTALMLLNDQRQLVEPRVTLCLHNISTFEAPAKGEDCR